MYVSSFFVNTTKKWNSRPHCTVMLLSPPCSQLRLSSWLLTNQNMRCVTRTSQAFGHIVCLNMLWLATGQLAIKYYRKYAHVRRTHEFWRSRLRNGKVLWGRHTLARCPWLLYFDIQCESICMGSFGWFSVHMLITWCVTRRLPDHSPLHIGRGGTQDIGVLQRNLSTQAVRAVAVVQMIPRFGWKCVIHLSHEVMHSRNKDTSFFCPMLQAPDNYMS